MHAVCRPVPPEPSEKFEIVRSARLGPDAVARARCDTSGLSGENPNFAAGGFSGRACAVGVGPPGRTRSSAVPQVGGRASKGSAPREATTGGMNDASPWLPTCTGSVPKASGRGRRGHVQSANGKTSRHRPSAGRERCGGAARHERSACHARLERGANDALLHRPIPNASARSAGGER